MSSAAIFFCNPPLPQKLNGPSPSKFSCQVSSIKISRHAMLWPCFCSARSVCTVSCIKVLSVIFLRYWMAKASEDLQDDIRPTKLNSENEIRAGKVLLIERGFREKILTRHQWHVITWCDQQFCYFTNKIDSSAKIYLSSVFVLLMWGRECYINRYEETWLQLYSQTGRYQILTCGQFVAKYQISRSHSVKISKVLSKKPRLIIMWASRGTY